MGLESTYFNLKHRLEFVFEPVNNIEKYEGRLKSPEPDHEGVDSR